MTRYEHLLSICITSALLAAAPAWGGSDDLTETSTTKACSIRLHLSLDGDQQVNFFAPNAAESTAEKSSEYGDRFDRTMPSGGSTFDAFLLGAFQDEPAAASKASGGHGNLAEQATNPAAPIVQMQFQNVAVPESYAADGYANQFIVQAVIPLPPMGSLPQSIWRPTLPIVSQPDPDGTINGTDGLGDFTLIGGPIFKQDWGMLVLGPALTAPTATDARLGARQWQLGPAVIIVDTHIPKVQYGAMIFNKWGLGGAGDQYTNVLSIQPIFNYHFEQGWYTGVGDYTWTFDWENNENYIPLSVRVGRVFAIGDQQVNMFVSPYYNVGDDIALSGQWGIKFSLTLLFPQ